MIQKSDKIEKLRKEIEELDLDIQALDEERRYYYLKNGLPIESLDDSFYYERNEVRRSGSLRDIHNKIALDKLRRDKLEELDARKCKLRLVQVEEILKNINDILDNKV